MIDPMAAFYDRVATDVTLQGIIGTKPSGKARFYPEFPDETLTESSFPRGTYFLASDDRQGVSLLVADIQADIWVWPTGAAGGSGKVQAIDDRMLVLLNGSSTTNGAKGVAWTFGGARIFSREVGARDFPTAPGTPLRRRRTYRLTVS